MSNQYTPSAPISPNPYYSPNPIIQISGYPSAPRIENFRSEVQSYPSAPEMEGPNYPSTPMIQNSSYTPLQVMPGQSVPIATFSIGNVAWGKHSQNVICPFCRSSTLTYIKHERGLFTWASCLGISILGCNAGCCLLPFFIKEFKDCYHYCRYCNSLLGIRKVLS